METRSVILSIAVYSLFIFSFAASVSASLSFDCYAASYPSVELSIRNTVSLSSSTDPSIPGKLPHLLFHDCFVEGCDAYLMLQGNNTEQSDPGNRTVGGFSVIESAKRVLENINKWPLMKKKNAQRLYELGARRVLVTGTGPLGCVPSQLAMRSRNGECVPELQQAAQIFNPQLVQMTRDLNSQLGADVFVAVNAFLMNMNFITNPQRYGFVTSKIACCGQGPYNGLGQCNPLSNLCPNRDVYAFWDAFHPTQRAVGFIVDEIFRGTSDLMSPMNLSTIMALDSKI